MRRHAQGGESSGEEANIKDKINAVLFDISETVAHAGTRISPARDRADYEAVLCRFRWRRRRPRPSKGRGRHF